MFKIVGQDGKEYGPVTAEVVQRWIAEGRATAQTRVQAEGGTDWKTLGELPEFKDALSLSAGPPSLPPRPTMVAISPRAEGPDKTLAVISLVLGILSLFTLFVAGIPAIITGAIARSRVTRDPARYGGGGLALAGLILGCCGALITFLAIPAALLLPALAKAKARAQTIQCVNNLKQIGLAARIYSADNKEVFPRDFVSMSNELTTPMILTCPADTGRRRMTSWAEFSPGNVSYEYLVPGATEAQVLSQPAFRCPIHNNVCMGDGSVQQLGGTQPFRRPQRR